MNDLLRLWRIPENLIEEKEDKKLLDFVLDQLKEPEAFLSKVQALYKTLDEDFDVLYFKDGRVFERFSSPLIRNGEIAGRVWSFRDITERKRAEEDRAKLQEEAIQARREWEEIFQAIGHPTMIMDAHHTVLTANRATALVTGKSEADMVGRKCFEIFHPDISQPAVGCPLEKLLASGRLETMEMEMSALGGTFLVSCTPMFSENGQLEKIIHIATDITTRKQVEKQLRKEMTLSDNTINSLPGIFYCVDDQGRFLRWNRNFEQVSGYTREEFAKLSPLDLFEDEDRTLIVQAIREVF